MKAFMFFGEIFTVFVETHLELCMAGTIMTRVADNNQDNNGVMWTVGSLFLMISFVLLPSIIIWVLFQKLHYYKKPSFVKKWGVLLKGLGRRNKWQSAFFLAFVIRRIVYVLSYAFLE